MRKGQDPMKNNRKFGAIGEDIACAYLEKQGYSVTERNLHFGHIETDVICEDETHVLFVEVKTRTDADFSLKYGRPASAVTKAKLANMLECARKYIYERKIAKKPRIDVIEVYLSEFDGVITLSEKGINHIKNVTG